ncbi:hypothetical protein HNR62_000301 [Oceanisphaera litoralis]|uniref:hypothetical protein n=1 Tax=Oceanisphaera litoralis TaxID=225144 RepID=UPI00195B0620|nr:hypothetical protein [Oceanisphaera litoralis]MBM7454472.1 hypothetical protein [Oceanisphaera litoralis]
MANIALKLLLELGKGFVGRIAWRFVAERFLTRTAVAALRKLERMSSNQVVDDTVEDIIAQLEGRGLPAAREYSRK